MSSSKKTAAPADKLELYEKLVKTVPEIKRKGAANPYTSLNGHMFSYLNASGMLALRLPVGEREKFLKKYKTTLFEAYGVTMKEYVTVPDSLLADTRTLRLYFKMSVDYIQSLSPKPTTREKR